MTRLYKQFYKIYQGEKANRKGQNEERSRLTIPFFKFCLSSSTIFKKSDTIKEMYDQNHVQKLPNGQKMKDVSGSVMVIMVPLPAQGHLNQLLELAYLVAPYGIPVHYVGSVSHNRQAKLRSHIPPSSSPCDVCFHNFPTPPFLSLAPNPNSTYRFPSHLQPAFDAASLLRGPVASLIRSLSSESRRVVMVHDSLMGSVVQDVASVPNAENYVFHSVSAFALYWYTWEATGRVLPREEEVDIAELLSSKGFPSLQVSFSNEFLKFIASQHEFKKLSSGSIYNTCRVVEGRYVDLFASATSNSITTKHWAFGPLNTVKVPEKSSRRSAHVCIEWLDKQEPSSEIYVSFGTTTDMAIWARGPGTSPLTGPTVGNNRNRRFRAGSNPVFFIKKKVRGKGKRPRNRRFHLFPEPEPPVPEPEPATSTTTALSDEQIREIAMALERSGQKFIWVLREADKADIFSGVTRKIELPQGFEETVEARDSGMVVRDWAPQLEILGHPTTGGLLSHCGWNSCMESISMGVPILAWPMHSDQPRNAVLITRVLKIGLIVKDWMSQDDVVESSTIQGAVKALMVSEEGEEMRKTAAELGAAVRGSMDEGGVSRAELDSFITHISR